MNAVVVVVVVTLVIILDNFAFVCVNFLVVVGSVVVEVLAASVAADVNTE